MNNNNVYNIVISEKAEANLDKIVVYLSLEWNEKVKNNFLEKFRKNIYLLTINPYLFQVFGYAKILILVFSFSCLSFLSNYYFFFN